MTAAGHRSSDRGPEGELGRLARRLGPLDDEWRDGAACKGLPAGAFFPERGELPAAEVLGVCRSCPVRRPCLEYALATGDPGVWGGTTAKERRRLRRGSAA